MRVMDKAFSESPRRAAHPFHRGGARSWLLVSAMAVLLVAGLAALWQLRGLIPGAASSLPADQAPFRYSLQVLAVSFFLLALLTAGLVWRNRTQNRRIASLIGDFGGVSHGMALFDGTGAIAADPTGCLQDLRANGPAAMLTALLEGGQAAALIPCADTAGAGALTDSSLDLSPELVLPQVMTAVENRAPVCVRIRCSGNRTMIAEHAPTHDGGSLILVQDASADAAHLRSLEEARDRYVRLTDIASDWVWQTDSDHRIVSVSDRFRSVTGLEPDTMIGRRFVEIADIRRDPQTVRKMHHAMQNAEPLQNIVVPTRLEGRHGPMKIRLSGHSLSDENSMFAGYFGVAADITRQWQAETRAEEARRALRDAVGAASDGIVLFDAEKRFVLCNRTFANAFAPAGHLFRPGTPVQEIFDCLSEHRLLRPTRQDSSGLDAHRIEDLCRGDTSIEFASGTGVWYRVSASLTPEDGLVLIFADISEVMQKQQSLDTQIVELRKVRDNLEQQTTTLSQTTESLSRARAEAEAANRAKSEFLAAISHELRTPLNAIIGFSEVMSTEAFGPLGGDRYRVYADDILNSGRHLLGLINNILDLTKAESGKAEPKLEPVHIRDTVDTCVRLAFPEGTRTRLQVDVDPDLDEFIADPQMLRQILINLISNAVKFTPPGGEINVSARHGVSSIIFAIRDTGIGMREEDIPKALTAFRQIDSTLSRKFEGTGLGLPLARTLTELHGGTLKIDSALGVGTTVVVTLPERPAIDDAADATEQSDAQVA